MATKNYPHLIPIAALITSSTINWIMVHWWAAEILAKQMNVSVNVSYYALCSFIALMAIVRTVNILRGRDGVTNRIDAYFDKRHKKQSTTDQDE